MDAKLFNEKEKKKQYEADIVELISKFGFMKATDLAAALNPAVSWDGETQTVTLS